MSKKHKNKKVYDCIVIGAGPSGLSTAIRLALGGWKVAVVERLGFPRQKICGGFIGYENKRLLESFGVWDEIVTRGEALREIFLSAGKGFHITLNEGHDLVGVGISRCLFDGILARRARELGVEIIDNATHTIKESGCIKICAVKHVVSKEIIELRSRHFVRATGLNRKMIKGPKHLGAYALFKNVKNLRDVGMYFVDGGHLGVNHFEDGLVNFCYVAEERLFNKYQEDMKEIFDHFIDAYPDLKQGLSEAQQITPFKGLKFGRLSGYFFMDAGSYLVGDGVSAINPVVGGGNTLALTSGALLAEQMLKYSPDNLDKEEVLRRYEADWRRAFEGCIRQAWFWGNLSHRPWLVRCAMKVFQWQKMFLTRIFKNQHKPLLLKFAYPREEEGPAFVK